MSSGWWMMHIRQNVLLEKKHRFEMGRETHSDIKYSCGKRWQEIGWRRVDFLLQHLVSHHLT